MEQLYEKIGHHPFFQGLTKDEILSLLLLCHQKGYMKSDIMFHAHEQREGILLLLSGFAEVYVGDEVLEVVRPGELIGLSSIAGLLETKKGDSEYRVEVRATSAVQCLLIPENVIKIRLQNPLFHQYLLTQLAIRLKDIYGSLAEQVALTRKGKENGSLTRRVQDIMTKELISVNSSTPISEAAHQMTTHRISSVLVIEGKKVEGIITERDLVARVLGEQVSYESPVRDIMTRSPITISRYAYYYEALSTFILHGVKHLPVVHEEEVVGIITLSDVLRRKNDNMMKTIRAIETANEETLPTIKTAIYDVVEALLQDDVPIYRLLDSVTKLYDRLVKRCIDMAIEKLSKTKGLLPPVSFCFYQMGSAGREEQFILTDQDHFLVYESAEENETEVTSYFESLGNEIVRLLEKAGYARCMGDMMASNPRWRGSIDTWMSRIHSWSISSTNQVLLVTQNFFSYRFLYGDEKLHQQFERRLAEELKHAKILLFRLHEVEKEHPIPTLDHPIRALFKLDRKQLELKKEILFPYHHSVQLLSLSYGILSGTPFERIDKLVERNAFSEAFAKDVKAAIQDIMKFYVRQRWNQSKNKEDLTSVLKFAELTTKEKEELILSVKIVKEIQSLVNSHF